MKSDTNEQEEIRRYLLGRVPPQDLPALEERVFLDSELYEELSIIEDELIDEYLRGELAPSDRERFESHFMSAPERHEKMGFARALRKHVDAKAATQPQEFSTAEQSAEGVSENAAARRQRRPFFSFLPWQNPIVSYSLAAAVILVLVGVSWTVWKNSPTGDPGKVLAVTLAPGLSRSEGETTKIVVPAGIDTVELRLETASADQYQNYRAVLLTSEGSEKFRVDDLKPTPGAHSVVFFQLASGLLSRGDYYVKLSGQTSQGEYEQVGRYHFRVPRN